MMTARVLLTMLAVVQGVATPLIDLNRTHATNPAWTGHARLHVVWQAVSTTLLAVVTTVLLWGGGPGARQRFYLAAVITAVPSAGFVIAQVSRRIYGGTMADPNGIPPLRLRLLGRVIEVDGNAAAVYSALVLLTAIVLSLR